MTIRKNISNILVGIAIFLLLLVLFKTKDEVSNPVIVNPTTTERVLPNGQVSQVKENGYTKEITLDNGKKYTYIRNENNIIIEVVEI
jgi:hypothetical protein